MAETAIISSAFLHYILIKFIIENGYAPDTVTLSDFFNCSVTDVEAALYVLQDYHGVVLHPNQPKVWAIHPFSTAPTNFYVTSSLGQWWGNCAWCSLGIAAILKKDVTITTSLGAEESSVKVHIRDGQILEKDLLVHFPISMNDAWNNVIYTCSTMLLFHSPDQIDDWCARHAIEKGDIQPIDKVWIFARKWYGNHLDPNWKNGARKKLRKYLKNLN